MRKALQKLLLVVALSLPSISQAKQNSPEAHDKTLWQTIEYNNQTIGLSIEKSKIDRNLITNTKTYKIKSRQGYDKVVRSKITIKQVETLDGEAISYSKIIKAPNLRTSYKLTIKNRTLITEFKTSDSKSSRKLKIPGKLLFKHGVKKAIGEAVMSNEQTSFYQWNFQSESFDFVSLFVFKLEKQPGAANKKTWRVEETRTQKNKGKSKQSYFLDQNLNTLDVKTELFGKQVKLKDCYKDCEKTRIKPLSPLTLQFVPSPYRIPHSALKGRIRYKLTVSTSLKQPPQTYNQQVITKPQGYIFDVCEGCGTSKTLDSLQLSQFLRSNPWLQSDHPKLVRIIKRKRLSKKSPETRLKILTRFVHKYMSDKAQYGGYASALEALETRNGDCTEYALLLTALARVAGVPSRVALGLTYVSDDFYGKKDVFTPHAWTQSYIDGRWLNFDSGLDGFNSGYITLAISNGEKQTAIDTWGELHSLKIISAAKVSPAN